MNPILTYFGNLSLRSKFILCLLVTSLSSVAVIGTFAYTQLMHKFDKLVLNDAKKGFYNDISAYFHVYGTWENGRQIEPFRVFSMRRRVQLGIDRPPPNDVMDVPPPPPDRQGLEGQGQQMRGFPPNMPPPRPGNMHRPPFRFYLFDTHYRALLRLPPFEVGDLASPEIKAQLEPIYDDGRLVAFYSPNGKINYSDLDMGYLNAMREAIAFGTIAALLITLLLGVIFANRLSFSLIKLTKAAQAMTKGQLQQHVDIDTKDEIGLLAQSFNQMSEELSRSHSALSASNLQIRQQAQQLRELSQRDALTQLYNRGYFDEKGAVLFKQAQRYQRPLSVMIGDIDYFKKINDSFSHATGDEVLRQVSEILATKVRSSDLVARYGGEEFVIAFPETNLTQAQVTCDTLRARIENHPWHEVHPDLKVTMSMGLSTNTAVKDLHEMLKEADKLLYRAKHNGRNQVCVGVEHG